MERWPESWAVVDADQAPGQRLVVELRPFIASLIARDLAARTVRRHVDSLWAICGEIVRQFDDDPALRQRSARRLLTDAVDSGEAPLLRGATQAEQRSTDATARRLLGFLQAEQ